MKQKLLQIVLAILFATGSIFSQWSVTTNNGISSQLSSWPRLVSDATYLYLDGSYRSSDNGENWTQIPYALSNNRPNAMIVFQGKLFSAHNTSGGTILYSTDNGSTWQGVTGAPANTSTNGFVILGNDIFAYASGGVFKSSDGGLNWANKGAAGIDVTMTEHNGVLIVGSTNNGLFRSTDNGETWSAANTGLNGDYNAGILWRLGTKVYFNAQSGKTYESSDQGSNWTQTTLSSLPSYGSISEISRVGSRVYIRVQAPNLSTFASESYLFVASDSDTNWINITDNLPIADVKMGKELTELNGYVFIGYRASNNYFYKRDLSSIISDVNDELTSLPIQYNLDQNYPNPFNPSTSISYQLSAVSNVNLKVYDIIGREVANLVNKEQPIGNYKVNFDASNLTSGVYFYRIIAGGFVQTKKMLLLK